MAVGATVLLVGAGASLLVVSLARGAVPRRWYGAAGYLALVAALALSGCRPAPKATVVATAQVDAGLSVYEITPPPPCSNCISTYGLAAYSARDGSTRWTYTPPAPGVMPYSLVFHAGMLFAFTWKEGDAQHATLTAMRAADGKPLWHVLVQGFPPPIAVTGDYIAVETQTGSASIPPHLLVLRAADGAQLHDIPLTLGGSVVADGDGAYICSDDGMLSAYRLSSGQPIWKIAVIPGAPRTDYEGSCLPRAVDGTLYYLVDSHVSLGVATPTVGVSTPTPNSTEMVAARESDGHMLWHQPLLNTLPVVHEGMLFAAVPSDRPGAHPYDTDMAAFGVSDGRLLWRIAGGPPRGAPIVVSGSAVVYAQGNALIAVRASDGAPLWQRQEPHRAFIPMAATDGVVLARSTTTYGPRSSPPSDADLNTYLVALRPSDGATDWQIPQNSWSVIALNVEP